MPHQANASKPGRKYLFAFVIWTVLGLLFSGHIYLVSNSYGQPMIWTTAVAIGLRDWYLWALLSLPIFEISRRFPLTSERWQTSLLVHLPAGFIVAMVYVLALLMTTDLLSGILGPVPFSRPMFRPPHEEEIHGFGLVLQRFTSGAFFLLLVYWALVACWHGLDFYRQLREREGQAQELARRLAESRLQALKMQLQPHFLFNTLNTIASLVHQDPKAADEMIGDLSELLRLVLDERLPQQIPLREELRFLERYLEIEQTRFGDRLSVQRDCESATLDVAVPSLILQPLVENAIRHGLERSRRPGIIRIQSRRGEDRLVVKVIDNGPGLANREHFKEGVGLANCRARLQELYGEQHDLTFRNRLEGGFEVELRIPWQVLNNAGADQPAATMPVSASPSGTP